MKSSAQVLMKTGQSLSEFTLTAITLLALNALLIIPVTGAITELIKAQF